MSAADIVTARIPRRSVGLKLLLVAILAVAMSVPALFVFLLLNDRTHRAEQVAGEISAVVGGPQTFLGPVLGVPYVAPATDPKQAPSRDVFVIFPVTGDARLRYTEPAAAPAVAQRHWSARHRFRENGRPPVTPTTPKP